MKLDLLVVDALVVNPFQPPVRADVGIHEGRIVSVSTTVDRPPARRTVDAQGRPLLPGVIDPHVHTGYVTPDQPERELATETAHGVLGGVTSFVKMERSFDDYDYLDELIPKYQENSLVDFAIHLTLMTEEQLSSVARYADHFGVSSFKFFMGRRDPEPGSMVKRGVDDGYLLEGFDRVAELGGTALVHAENQDIIWRMRRQWREQGRGDDQLASWSLTSPSIAEAENIQRAGMFARQTGCPLYVVHLSSAAGLAAVRDAAARGTTIHAETCAHYLTHTQDSEAGYLAKVNPPVRTSVDNDGLWQGLADAGVTCMGSDHGAKPLELKGLDGSIWDAAAGFPNMMHTLPVLLSEGVGKGRLDLRRVAELTAGWPARIFGLTDRGAIAPGMCADLMLLDLELEKTVSAQWHRSGAPYSIYEGVTFRGWPVLTVARGELVMEDGEILPRSGPARYLRRAVGTRGR
ncbi:MAG: amidohydrolase family protein [Micromonosporaceae bacterium]|nr:amidohydrolase family protein [Micromonosporaceae bacterium]